MRVERKERAKGGKGGQARQKRARSCMRGRTEGVGGNGHSVASSSASGHQIAVSRLEDALSLNDGEIVVRHEAA